jgi:hypothetical protein
MELVFAPRHCKVNGLDENTREIQWEKLLYSAENPVQLNLEGYIDGFQDNSFCWRKRR